MTELVSTDSPFLIMKLFAVAKIICLYFLFQPTSAVSLLVVL